MRSSLYVNDVKITKDIPKGNYLGKLPVVRNLLKMDGLHFEKKVTFLVGENGIGKSTLIEGIAVAMGFNPEGERSTLTSRQIIPIRTCSTI